jgi:hypothetical protein
MFPPSYHKLIPQAKTRARPTTEDSTTELMPATAAALVLAAGFCSLTAANVMPSVVLQASPSRGLALALKVISAHYSSTLASMYWE